MVSAADLVFLIAASFSRIAVGVKFFIVGWDCCIVGWCISEDIQFGKQHGQMGVLFHQLVDLGLLFFDDAQEVVVSVGYLLDDWCSLCNHVHSCGGLVVGDFMHVRSDKND